MHIHLNIDVGDRLFVVWQFYLAFGTTVTIVQSKRLDSAVVQMHDAFERGLCVQ